MRPTQLNELTLQKNLTDILYLAEIENYFVANPERNWSLTFEPNLTLLEGIEQVISLLPGWQLSENTSGMVGIGPVTDNRFEQPSVYVFERDKTCWSYN